MKLLLTGNLLTELPLYILLLLISSSNAKWRYLNAKEQNIHSCDMYHEPSREYEQLRRRIKKNVVGFWRLLSSELDDIQKSVEHESRELANRIVSVIRLGTEFQAVLRSDLEGLHMTDGYAEWREREAAELSELMQLRLDHLQNPKDCNSARKAVFSLVGWFGFGSELHILVFRFIIAYATNRTLVVDTRHWSYDPNGWENNFYPLSDTCTNDHGSSRAKWSGKNYEQVVSFPNLHPFLPSAPFFPRTFPADLAPRLGKLHGNPFAWWMGQFLKYILRPREHIEKAVEEIAERRRFARPFVGVHIRRTDKIHEANYVPVEKYMAEVDVFYRALEISQDVPLKRIYLATDDPGVILEMEYKYRDRYEIFSNSVLAKSIDREEHRYNTKAMMGILFDIIFLSLADYLVCTLSSNVCRVAYEIMQIFHPDASDRICSLDSKYYVDFEMEESFTAVYPHYAPNLGEMSLELGDNITDVIDLWNGYSVGVNRRSKEAGWYPSFKVDEMMKTFDFPIYSDILVKKRKK